MIRLTIKKKNSMKKSKQKQEKYLIKNQTFSYALQRLQELFISRAKRR